jgi:hypothetical protein
MRNRCRGDPFTKQLPSDGPGIVDVFTDRYIETGVCFSAYCIATAEPVHFQVSALQRVCTPQYKTEIFIDIEPGINTLQK